uniref:Mariner transposase [Bombyx mori] n=1 Tax=Lepeophtheirus salmonis TaxID=72036 RepID=A0A0K2T577_LEPSM
MQDRHVTYREILGISSTSIHSILHVHLAEKKVCSRWIRTVRQSLKRRLVSIGAKNCWKITLVVLQKIYLYEPETKQRSILSGASQFVCLKSSEKFEK